MAYQTYGYDKYREKVIDQLTTVSPSVAERGAIYDASGRLLATNKTTYRVFISPSAISSAQKQLDKKKTNSISVLISERLSEILGISSDVILKKTEKTGRLDETVVRNADEETAQRIRALIIEEHLEHLVFLEASTQRYYPYGSLASHVLGFTGADGDGLYGLEYEYNKEISGSDGYYVTARDSRGNELPNQYNTYTRAEDGYSITTTITEVITRQSKRTFRMYLHVITNTLAIMTDVSEDL